MRKVIKFFDIIFITLALIVFVLSTIVSNFTLNKDYIKKLLRENNIYSTINDEIKKSVKTDLKVSLSEVPNLNVEELVDRTITEDILEKELDYILTTLYSTNKMKVDLSILSKGYSENLDNYIKNNNIKVPEKIEAQIKNVMETNSLGEEDITFFNENYSRYFAKSKDIIKKVRMISLISLITLVGLTLLLAKQKIRGLYIPALLSSASIYEFGVLLKSFLDTQDIKIGDKKLEVIVTSVKESLFSSINNYVVTLLIIGVVLIIVKIIYKVIISLKRRKKDIGLEIVNNNAQKNESDEEINRTMDEDIFPNENLSKEKIEENKEDLNDVREEYINK